MTFDNDPKKEIVASLNQLVHVSAIDPETVVAVTKIVTSGIDSWRESVVGKLQQKIIDWESVMGDKEDTSFYSLGMRRAIDVIMGESAYDGLPILEKPDTPDSRN